MRDLSSTKTILVPTDFTSVAESATDHANHLAKLLNKTVTLVHVVEREKERKSAQAKLNNIANENFEKSGIVTNAVIDIGNIFDEIGKVADIVGATIVIMGTHGIRGIQKLFGSYALRVINNSSVPYVVVQNKPIGDGYKNIVLPIDFSKESKQKLNWAAYIAKLFNSKCHILADFEKDEFMAKALKNNLAYARSFLKAEEIEFDVVQLGEDAGDMGTECIKYAEEINADLIVVVTTIDKSLAETFTGPSEQYIIANHAKLPVMVVQALDILRSKDGLDIANFG